MGKKVTPKFGSLNEKPSAPSIIDAIKANVTALLSWARTTQQKVVHIEDALGSHGNAWIEMNGHLESVCRILIENGVVDKEKLAEYAEEYVSGVRKQQEEQVKILAEAIEAQRKEKESKIWTPPATGIIRPVR